MSWFIFSRRKYIYLMQIIVYQGTAKKLKEFQVDNTI